MPAASEAATAVETTETATHMAETSDMGDTHAVGETATSKMGDIYAAVSETVTSKMGGTYAAAETYAVMGDGPPGAYHQGTLLHRMEDSGVCVRHAATP